MLVFPGRGRMFLKYLALCRPGANAQSMLFYLSGSYAIIPILQMSELRLEEHTHPGSSAHSSDHQPPSILLCEVIQVDPSLEQRE